MITRLFQEIVSPAKFFSEFLARFRHLYPSGCVSLLLWNGTNNKEVERNDENKSFLLQHFPFLIGNETVGSFDVCPKTDIEASQPGGVVAHQGANERAIRPIVTKLYASPEGHGDKT